MPIVKRNTLPNGVAGSTDREGKGVKGVRGEAAVSVPKAEVERLRQIKTKD